MRTHLEFRSTDLLDAHDDADIPHGEAVAKLLGSGLSDRGFQTGATVPEDWGWCLKIRHDAFPLWIGCGFYPEYEDGLLCFIHPSKPYVRRWFKRISTAETVERLATALEDTLRESRKVHDLRWWTEAEVKRG